MTVRAKFACTAKIVRPSSQEGFDEEAALSFSAVCGNFNAEGEDEHPENRIFGKWTPSASLTMTIRNKVAYDQFEQGKEYYLDFTPAE